jgi:hypothetical protein
MKFPIISFYMEKYLKKCSKAPKNLDNSRAKLRTTAFRVPYCQAKPYEII